MTQRGVLLVNLGSPDSTRVNDVRRFLREFLMDARVLDAPYLTRFCLVHFCILPFRARKTAEAYRKIWRPEGSPLIVISEKFMTAVQKQLAIPVALGMRYQNPSIETAIRELRAQDVDELLLFPLYPHYAMSSYESVVARVRDVLGRLAPNLNLKVVPPFYDDPDYLEAMMASATDYLRRGFDHLLFSFHGLPERHLRKADPTGNHCLVADNCCARPSPAHRTCYRAQALLTVDSVAKRAGIPKSQYSVAFQSRLGRDPWLKPYTEHELVRLAKSGIKKLLVICPSFVTDCLETLEEIGLRGRETFRSAGGGELCPIPCLNDHPQWTSAAAKIVRKQWNSVTSSVSSA
ncbi:MAG: ferrochelatase [Candidatus Omnitrophica bacterium]|nr:ferrochelatase [Candidatus Omnitrophota bacterium]